jgi:hypothetical protein
VIADVPEEHTVSIIRVEANMEVSYSSETSVITYKATGFAILSGPIANVRKYKTIFGTLTHISYDRFVLRTLYSGNNSDLDNATKFVVD